MKILVVGFGEVGGAHARILAAAGNDVRGVDLVPEKVPEAMRLPEAWESEWGNPDVMLVAIRFKPDFVEDVVYQIQKFTPARGVNVLSTVEPGTCLKIASKARTMVCHSTTRGLHPNLESGLLAVVKHIGGPGAEAFARMYRKAGMTCRTTGRAVTTEVAHILNNASYGINLMFADEMAKICREYGADYIEAVVNYTATNNAGYEELDHPSKVRPVLTPPNGRIGGHCVRQSAGLIPIEKRTPMLKMLAEYGEQKPEEQK